MRKGQTRKFLKEKELENEKICKFKVEEENIK